MSSLPKWPTYAIGSPEAIFCVGMISVNFAELTSVFSYIFTEIFDLDMDGGRAIVSKIGEKYTIDLAKERLKSEKFEIKNADLLGYFLTGFDVCLQNRNELLHAELSWMRTDRPFFVRASRQGNMIGCLVTVQELQNFADSIKEFSNFGRAVINANGWPELAKLIENAPPISDIPSPDKPLLPKRIEFRSGPLYYE